MFLNHNALDLSSNLFGHPIPSLWATDLWIILENSIDLRNSLHGCVGVNLLCTLGGCTNYFVTLTWANFNFGWTFFKFNLTKFLCKKCSFKYMSNPRKSILACLCKSAHIQWEYSWMNMPACITSLHLTQCLSQRNQTLLPCPPWWTTTFRQGNGQQETAHQTALNIFGNCYSDNDIRLIWLHHHRA